MNLTVKTNTNTKLNVAVIFGGCSVEHEISVISGLQCIWAIDRKYHVVPIYITKQGVWYTGDKLLAIENFKDLDKLLTQCQKILCSQNANDFKLSKANPTIFGSKVLASIDLVVPITHGSNGEDGVLQGLLELMNIPYVGCDVLSSAITMDKIVSKMLLRSLAIPVLDDVWFYAYEWINDQEKVLAKINNKLTYPLIVKPGNLGSSVGVTAVDTAAELEDAIDLAVSMSSRIIVEPKVTNLKEINCSVLGDHEMQEVSVCEEPVRSDAILSYHDKYLGANKCKGKLEIGDNHAVNQQTMQGMSGLKRKIPADIPEATSRVIQELARLAFVNLDCSGVVRADFLIDQDNNRIYLCELNTIPGSLAFYLWQPMNKSFTELTNRLIELAFKKHREKNNLTRSYGTNILKNFQGQALNK